MGFGKDGKGVIIMEDRTQVLGALAAKGAAVIGTKLATLERFRMLRGQAVAVITGLTAGEGAGLLLILADGDLSSTEIQEAIETEGPLGPNDSVTEDITERPVWIIGATEPTGASETQVMLRSAESGGFTCVTKPRWTFARTKSWEWLIYNQGTSLTTGATVHLKAKSFGVWVT